jgi:uncharacterized protein (DUF362 family)
MDRRQFCKFAGVCGLAACTGGLVGCARLLDWSANENTAQSRSMKPAAEASETVEPTRSAEASSAAETTETPEAAWPDLAVYRGDDPSINVRRAVSALGGMGRFVKRGARVVLKPNLLTGRSPEFATTTNPIVVGTVVKMCFEAGADDVIVLDRPTGSATTAFQVSGIARAVDREGGRVKYLTDRNFDRVAIPNGRHLRSWPFVADVFEADTFINMPIAKTHGMAILTMSMKNLMGIMGGERGTMHQDFEQKIVDVNSLVRPHLVILDAYRMLIRNGPTGGDLRDVRLAKTVVVGTNQASVDAFGTTLFGMKPTDLDYLHLAGKQGIGIIDLAKLSILKGTT